MSIKKIHETVLDRQAREVVYLKSIEKTMILSGDGKNVYLFDEIARSFMPVTLNYRDDNDKSFEITSIAVSNDEKTAALALASTKYSKINVISTLNFRTLFSTPVSADAARVAAMSFGSDGSLTFTRTVAGGPFPQSVLCLMKPPYSAVEETLRTPVMPAASLVDADNRSCRYYNENTNALFVADGGRCENNILASPFTASAAGNGTTSALFSIGRDSFGLVRGDNGEIAVYESKALSKRVKFNFARGARPVVCEARDVKYAFIGSTGRSGFFLFDREKKDAAIDSNLGGMTGISAAAISR